MINRYNDDNFKQVFDGVRIKTTVYGEQSLMTEFRMGCRKPAARAQSCRL